MATLHGSTDTITFERSELYRDGDGDFVAVPTAYDCNAMQWRGIDDQTYSIFSINGAGEIRWEVERRNARRDPSTRRIAIALGMSDHGFTD